METFYVVCLAIFPVNPHNVDTEETHSEWFCAGSFGVNESSMRGTRLYTIINFHWNETHGEGESEKESVNKQPSQAIIHVREIRKTNSNHGYGTREKKALPMEAMKSTKVDE